MKMTLAARFRKIICKWFGRNHKSILYCPHFCRFCEFRDSCSFDVDYELYEEIRQAFKKGVTHGTYKDVYKEGFKPDSND